MPISPMNLFTTTIAPWFTTYIGAILVRTELHPWVNVILLTVIYPIAFWFLSKNTLYPDISQGGIIASVIFATLFITLLLEARPKSSFSKQLKKNFKEYGREPLGTSAATLAIVTSLAVGVGFSMIIQQQNFLKLEF